jgi:hypothetical protein
LRIRPDPESGVPRRALDGGKPTEQAGRGTFNGAKISPTPANRIYLSGTGVAPQSCRYPIRKRLVRRFIFTSSAPTDMASVIEILIAPSAGAPMVSLQRVLAIPGKGLQDDRYYSGTGTFSKQPQSIDSEMTLIESEMISSFAKSSGQPFDAACARRNIVTEGVDLNALLDVDFLIGGVRVRGLRLCEPCKHLAALGFPEVLPGLIHKAGLRVHVLSEGILSVGDAIRRVD